MAESKRARKIIRGKVRLVQKSKWELPMRGSTLYWNKICEGIESKVKRVRNPPIFSPTFYPDTFSSTHDSTSSVNSDDVLTKHLPTAKVANVSIVDPIVKIYPPPSQNSTTANPSWILQSKNSQWNQKKECNDRTEPLENPRKMIKLSKMTKLVNDFLSSTRTKVRPHSTKISMSPLRKNKSQKNQKAELTRIKSFEDQSEDNVFHESSIPTMTSQVSKEKSTDPATGTRLEKRSVVFREGIEEIVEQFDPNEDITNVKPKRPRAPSLSVASAVPSFGRVVISNESISSIEDEEDHEKTKNTDKHTLNAISRDNSEQLESQLKLDSQKVTQHFLRVPEIGPIMRTFNPGRDRSLCQKQISMKKTQLRTEEVIKSKRLKEPQILQKKYTFWPRRSLVHMLHALKAMKHGARSKARIELETNRFFAAPLKIYSPSGRSSISSDDRTDIDESQLGCTEEQENGLEDNVSEESELSYASVRERLMRNAQAHIGKDFERDAFIDENNALDAASVSTDSSRFYNSLSLPEDKLKVERRNTKTSATIDFIAIPRMAAIFPRKKTDKCLACMCQSIKKINRTVRKQSDSIFSNGDNEMVLFEESNSGLSGSGFFNRTSFDQSYRMPVFEDDSVEKFVGENYSDSYCRSSFGDQNEEFFTVEIPSVPDPELAIGSLTRSNSRLDVPQQSRINVKPIAKALISAKTLISRSSKAPDRSKSISDHDDSDQGCIDPRMSDIGMSGSGASKNLAPCHMPLNLKPSLEPLKALRLKKSRSIRSRIASAEKSADSISGDEDDSDGDGNNRRLPVNTTKIRSGGNEGIKIIDIDNRTGKDSKQPNDNKQNVGEDQSQNGSEGSPVTESSETDLANAEESQYDKPIIPDREVIKIATKCLAENKTVTETLRVLAMEYSNRLSNVLSQDNYFSHLPNVRKTEKITKNLVTLLVDSKSYFNRGKLFNNMNCLSFSSKQPTLCNPRQLRRALPLKSYNLVAPILGMAKWYPKRGTSAIFASMKTDFRHKESSRKTFDLFVHPPSRATYRVSFEDNWDDARPKLSPYALFLSKPRRKVITWRPLTVRDLEGYNPEATLKMRAARITDRICEEFCQWLKSLSTSTDHTSAIDVDVLKDMFETDFTAEVCRTMQMSINEMPMVPDAVATARNCPRAAELALTRRHLVKDAKAAKKPKRTIGFGTGIPAHLKFIPPRNNVDEKWLQCENVPIDLETMDAVWKDITQLTSVRGFIEWLKAHPRVSRPKALEKALASEEILTRQSQEIEGFKDNELDLDQIQSLKVGDNATDV